ncbi:hypothetical protein Tco_0654866 [Tanacetum coccineum]|uniref:Uncharacterized protein n=1 Tax=Tanacetum coccineum TaxID=301880 RepID=A0ABQ4X4R2_9ASTR
MGSITSLKCVLTQEHLDVICVKYFVPEEVHPQLPSSDATMHEKPTGKIRMYTRFFDYANYRIPFYTFFVSVLTHFRIPFSQLSVFGSAKVSHFEILCRVCNIEPDVSYDVEEFLCWVGISRNYLLNKDTYPRFEYENGEGGFYFPARTENERPIVTVAKHRTVTLLPTSVVRSSGELSASVEREFAGDASVGDGGDQGFDSVGGQDDVEPTAPVTEPVERIFMAQAFKKKRVTRESERMPAASHPPKRLRADYGTTGGSATGGKSPSVLNRLLQDSRLTVEQGVPALPTFALFYFLRDSGFTLVGGRRPRNLRILKLISLVRSAAPIMTEATTVATVATTVAIPANVSKDKSSGLMPGTHSSKEAMGAGLEETYVPEWTVTRGFELNDGRLCANMIDHFTPPAFFKTVRGMEHEQLFTEFNVSAARNLSLSSEVRMRAEYNILEKRKWRNLCEEKYILLGAKDTESDDLSHLLLKEMRRLRESSPTPCFRFSVLRPPRTHFEVHELEISSTDLREKLEMYEGSLKQLEEFQDNLMGPLRIELAEIDVDFTQCLLVVKCLNSNEYMEALGHAFGRAIEKGMQEGLAAGIEHGQAGRCLTDLEAYIPSAEAI